MQTIKRRWVLNRAVLVLIGAGVIWGGAVLRCAASEVSSWADTLAVDSVGASGLSLDMADSVSPPDDARVALIQLMRQSVPRTLADLSFADPVRKATGAGGEVWELTATAGDVRVAAAARLRDGQWLPLYFHVTGLPAQAGASFEDALAFARTMVLHRGTEELELSAVRAPLDTERARLGTFGRREVASPWDQYWILMADDAPLANWAHPCRYLFVAADLSAVAVRHAQTPLSVQALDPTSTDTMTMGTPLLDFDIIIPFSPEPETAPAKKSDAPALTNTIRHDGSVSNCYAVIISGGANLRNNHIRYWGDSSFIYSTLTLKYEYPKENIITLISDGLDPEADRSDDTNSPFDLDGDGLPDINYPATFDAISNVFATLEATLTEDDQLFVFLTDHGSATEGGGKWDVELNLWNEEVLRDVELRAMTENIAAPIFFVMEQCHSGGFLDDLNQSNRLVATAAQPDESSWAGITVPHFNQWAYYWTAAMRGFYPASGEEPWVDGDPCFADLNGDGWVSFEEASEFAFMNKYPMDNPMYQDQPAGLGKRSFLTMVPQEELRMGEFLFDPLPEIVAGHPASLRIATGNAYGDIVEEYVGPATLRAEAQPFDPGIRVGEGEITQPMPLNTEYMDARSQIIYPASLMGGARSLDHLQLYFTVPPSLPVNQWTIRMKHTPMEFYPELPEWESEGWTVVYAANETLTATGWVTFVFSEVFDYDGEQSLMIDFSFYNDEYDTAGLCYVSMTNEIVGIGMASDNSFGDPLTWTGRHPAPIESPMYLNLRWGPPPVPVDVQVEPADIAAFTNGVWEGQVVTDQPAAQVRFIVEDATNAQWQGQTDWFQIHGAQTNYVDINSTNPVSPYVTWDTAATTIQDAVDIAVDGATIWVADGVYNEGGRNAPDDPDGPIWLTNRVFITKDIVVRSVNGPLHTVIEGAGPNGPDAVRGVYMRGQSELIGFTVRNGHVLASETIPTQRNRTGGGVFMEDQATVRDCVIVFCDGSGVANWRGGRIFDSSINYNVGESGGGLRLAGEALVERCTVLNNQAVADVAQAGSGGGAFLEGRAAIGYPVVRNTYFAGNVAAGPRAGGGAVMLEGAHLYNCTLVNNRSTLWGGGLFVEDADAEQQIVNCIVYHNDAPVGTDIQLGEDAAASVRFQSLCSPEPLPGDGQVLGDPLLAGIYNPHILADSPCRGAGDPGVVQVDELDIDGELRMGPLDTVDIGCDQYHAGAITGLLWPEIEMPFDTVVAGLALDLQVDSVGKASHFVWTYDDGSGLQSVTNALGVQPVFTAPGTYEVVLTAYNDEGIEAFTGTVHVVASFTNYVAPDGLHVAPYTSAENAATNVQAAIDACAIGGVTVVLPGVYREGAPIRVDKPMTLRADEDSDWADVVLDGDRRHRVLELDHPDAVVEGFTLRRGFAAMGGGALLHAGMLRHSLVEDNDAERFGGGVRLSGTARVESGYLARNRAGEFGGAAYADGQSVVTHSWITQNEARIGGGGLMLNQEATLVNSYLHENRAYFGGGAGMVDGGVIRNSTLTFNVADRAGGGVWLGTGETRNSIIYYNQAPEAADLLDELGMGTVHYSLTTPGVSGIGNITNAEPLLVGRRNPHILPVSPAVDAGDATAVVPGETDFDNEPRLYGVAVDMGCDEVIITNMTVSPWTRISGDFAVLVDEPATLWADGFGPLETLAWTVAGIGETNAHDNVSYIAPSWSEPGEYIVTLAGTTMGGVQVSTAKVQVAASGFINYVATNGLHVAPFTNWVTAATNVQSAINACPVGGTTLVGPGEYSWRGTVRVSKRMTLAGTGDPGATTLDGEGVTRVMQVDHADAFVHSLTLANGFASHGAGLDLRAGVVSNVVIQGNAAIYDGGGFRVSGNALLTHSTVSGNTAATHAGGQATGIARVRDVDFIGNQATGHAGGLGVEFLATADACVLRGNQAGTDGGGLYVVEGGVVRNSMVQSNHAGRAAAGAYVRGGRIENMHIAQNQSAGDVGGVYLSEGATAVSSLIVGNVATGQVGGVMATAEDYEFLPTVVSSSTIVNNESASSAAGLWLGPHAQVRNAIVSGNVTATGDPSEYVLDGEGQQVAHSRIWPLRAWFDHSLSADPLFVGGGDWSLQPASPLINAGSNEAWMASATDLAGQPRIQNLVVDLGAYESPYWSRYIDMDGDGYMDYVEAVLLGTDPDDPDSYLGMSRGGMDPVDGGVMVRWHSVAGKQYHVDRSTNLVAEPAFEEWLQNVEGAPDVTTVYDADYTNAPAAYYRIRLAP
jgi:PKD repeat protein